MPPSLADIEAAWGAHPLGEHRARGGRRALSGFHFQIAASLQSFVDLIDAGEQEAAQCFDSLSDLARAENGALYLVQMKTRLTRASAKSAVVEALAADAFLEQEFPDLRESARYQIQCSRRDDQVDPGSLTSADLKLDGAAAARWDVVRTRMLSPLIDSDPSTSLAIRLFPEVDDPFEVAQAMAGELLQCLGEDVPSEEISRRLLARLVTARRARHAEPPGRLLGVADFTDEGDGVGGRVLLGQRPTLAHLAAGYFMPRPDLVERIVTAVVEPLARGLDEEHPGVAVHWIRGASGAGKSVLLLQAVQRLVLDGVVPVHLLSHLPVDLEAALRHWRKATEPVLIAIDDLYSPGHRDPALWERISALVLQGDVGTRVSVVTCGPDDYREAFMTLARREEAFQINPVHVPNLSTAEQDAYRTWYQRRTGLDIPPPNEPLLVVAAFRAEMQRTGTGSLPEFAQRFVDRAEAAGTEQALLASLALNRLGLSAPAELFAEARDELDRLVAEEVVQREGDEGREDVGVYHPRVAAAIYDVVVPAERLDARANDLARGLIALAPRSRPASNLLHSLSDRDVRAKLSRRCAGACWSGSGSQSGPPIPAGHWSWSSRGSTRLPPRVCRYKTNLTPQS